MMIRSPWGMRVSGLLSPPGGGNQAVRGNRGEWGEAQPLQRLGLGGVMRSDFIPPSLLRVPLALHCLHAPTAETLAMRPLLCLPLACLCLALGAKEPAPLKNGEPLSPKREQATFAVPEGFRVELVASEPDVVDPVAMAFDERGRIFVAEMRGYPNGGRGTGVIRSGQIRCSRTATATASTRPAPSGPTACASPPGSCPGAAGCSSPTPPTCSTSKTPRAPARPTRRPSSTPASTWRTSSSSSTACNWASTTGSTPAPAARAARSARPRRRTRPPSQLRGRGIRFRPDVPGSLEPTSGGGQYGLSADDWGRWFVATNSQHLRHIVLPDAALRRNPGLAVPGGHARHPRTRGRVQGLPHQPVRGVARRTHHPPGRQPRRPKLPRRPNSCPAATSPRGAARSSTRPRLFPKAYRGSVFVCDPANNLILRDTLTPHGATFIAKRGHADREFLASTDNWFRPVHLTLGPDGAIYVLDFYREVIETPLSLPDDIKARVNLKSRARGRIWRITTAPAGTRPKRPALHRATTKQLVAHLADDNSWYRLTAQRLLLEKQAEGRRRRPRGAGRVADVGRRPGACPVDARRAGGAEAGRHREGARRPGAGRPRAGVAPRRGPTGRGEIAPGAGRETGRRRRRRRSASRRPLTLGASPTPEAAKALAKIARRERRRHLDADGRPQFGGQVGRVAARGDRGRSRRRLPARVPVAARRAGRRVGRRRATGAGARPAGHARQGADAVPGRAARRPGAGARHAGRGRCPRCGTSRRPRSRSR